MSIFGIIVIVIMAAAIAAGLDMLIKKTVKNEKQKKLWLVIADVLVGIAACAVVFFGALGGCALIDGGKRQAKEWIYSELSDKLWNEQTFNLANNEYKRILDVLETRGNAAIEKFTSDGDDEDLEGLLTASLFGLEDFYLLGNASNEKKRAAQVEKYKQRYDEVTDNLKANMSALQQSLRDSFLKPAPTYTDAELFATLLGTPAHIASPTADQQKQIARNIVTNLFVGREKPKVASCSYDRKNKAWNVRMDNAPNQVVKYFKRDDGNYDVEWTGNKDYVPPVKAVPAGGAEDNNGEVEDDYDEMMDSEPNGGVDDDEDEPHPSMMAGVSEDWAGYLENANGKQYEIVMNSSLTGEADEDGKYSLYGSYRYKSQPENNVINFEGYLEYPEKGGEVRAVETTEGFERFVLNDDGKGNLTGYWYLYKDEASRKKGGDDYKSRMKVVLKKAAE